MVIHVGTGVTAQARRYQINMVAFNEATKHREEGKKERRRKKMI
jgi:hypothetical protein